MEPTALEVFAWFVLTLIALGGGLCVLFAYANEIENRRVEDANYWREYDKTHSY